MPKPIRHHEVSRLEGFSDAVFAFALTLLVVSLETPKDVPALVQTMHKAGPFALTFAMVVWIWWQHNQFFRRYGLQDAWTATLNAVLLFVVLIYVYPLRFLTEALTGGLFGVHEDVTGPRTGPSAAADGRIMLLLYSAGIFFIFATFALLYWHAWRQRRELDLNPTEALGLRFNMRSHVVSMSLAIISFALIIVMPDSPQYGGWIYVLMGPAHAWNGTMQGRAQRALDERSAPAEQLQRQNKTDHEPHG